MVLDLQTIEKLSKQDLSKAINALIETNFNGLINLLYRIDINEKQLKQLLQNNSATNAGDIIADLILSRLHQKQITRQQFKQQTDIPDDEKW